MSVAAENIVHVGQIELRFFGSGTGDEGQVSFEALVPRGARVPPAHYHVEVDEFVYALDGTFTYVVDGVSRDLTRGESAFAPHGSVHRFANYGEEPARALVVLSPGKITKHFFAEFAAIINAGGPPDPEKMSAVMARHGLVTVH